MESTFIIHSPKEWPLVSLSFTLSNNQKGIRANICTIFTEFLAFMQAHCAWQAALAMELGEQLWIKLLKGTSVLTFSLSFLNTIPWPHNGI